MNKIIELKIIKNKNVFVKYSDMVEGVIDLSESVLKKSQEIESIDNIENIRIRVSEETGDIIINDNIELCKNATYEILKLKAQMKSFGINIDK